MITKEQQKILIVIGIIIIWSLFVIYMIKFSYKIIENNFSIEEKRIFNNSLNN